MCRSLSAMKQILCEFMSWSVLIGAAILLAMEWIAFASQLCRRFGLKETTYECFTITGMDDNDECKACGRKVYVGFRKLCPHCGMDPRRTPTKEEIEKFNKNVIRPPKPKEGE